MNKPDHNNKNSLRDEINSKDWVNLIGSNNENPEIYYKYLIYLSGIKTKNELLSEVKKTINKFPDYEKFYRLAGIICQKESRYDESIQFFEKSIELSKSDADDFNNLAIAYSRIRKNEKAIQTLLSGLALHPSNLELSSNLALIYHLQNNFTEAQKYYEISLQVDRTSQEVATNYTHLLNQSKQFGATIKLCDQFEEAGILNNQLRLQRAFAFEKINGFENALNDYYLVYEDDKNMPELIFKIGFIHEKLKNWISAEQYYREALLQKSNYSEAMFCLAGILHRLNKYDEAVDLYEKLLDTALNRADVLCNYAITLVEEFRFDEALKKYNEALRSAPEDPMIHLNKATLLLYMKRYTEAWQEYEYRLLMNGKSAYKKRKWKGESLFGKTLLIREEQGIGDLLQFIRYIKWFKDQGAGKIIVECRKTLHYCLRGIKEIDSLCLSTDTNVEFDYEIYIMSIPLVLNLDTENPLDYSYNLYVEEDRRKRCKELLGFNQKIKVGITWQGNPEHFYDYKRSIPFEKFKNILNNHSDIEYICLQTNEQIKGIENELEKNSVRIFKESSSNFDDLTALISELDLVISIDSAVVHIAGTLNKDAFVLLSKLPDWRWGLEGEKTNWYKSVKLFRQETNGDWDEVIQKVKDCINSFILSKKASRHFYDAEKYIQTNNISGAIEVLKLVLDTEPGNYDALFKLGYLHHLTNEYIKAVGYYSAAMQIKPHDVVLYNNFASALVDLKHFREAEKIYELSLFEFPDNEMLLNNYAILKQIQGDFLQSELLLRKALVKDPNSIDSLINLALVEGYNNNISIAIGILDKVISLDPGNVKAHFNKSLLLLKNKDFAAGWEEYEWRKKMTGFPSKSYSKPELDHLNIAGKTILIHDEQGFGDTFNFIRFVRFLKEKGAKVVLECHSNVANLLTNLYYIDRISERGTVSNKQEEYEYYIPLMSIPKLLGLDWELIKNTDTELKVEEKPIKKIDIISGKKVGIFWRGRQPVNNLQRACHLKHFIPLLEVQNCHFFSLQIEGIEDDESEIIKNYGIIQFIDSIKDFEDTASIIAKLDLVITIDTSIAHLAGIMEKPVWLLLSKNADWRWFNENDECVWYKNVTIYRQTKINNWSDVFCKLEEKLKNS